MYDKSFTFSVADQDAWFVSSLDDTQRETKYRMDLRDLTPRLWPKRLTKIAGRFEYLQLHWNSVSDSSAHAPFGPG